MPEAAQTARTASRSAPTQVNRFSNEIGQAGLCCSGTAGFLRLREDGTRLPVPHILVRMRR